jgi:hypothetical protein
MLELLDSLRDAIFEDLEVALREVGDWRVALRWIDINADVVRLSTECRLWG